MLTKELDFDSDLAVDLSVLTTDERAYRWGWDVYQATPRLVIYNKTAANGTFFKCAVLRKNKARSENGWIQIKSPTGTQLFFQQIRGVMCHKEVEAFLYRWRDIR